MNHLKYLIVGVPRSGTTFMSKAFNSIGIGCGHEKIFGPTKIGNRLQLNLKLVEERLLRFSNLKAESSWYAVPFLNSNFKLITNENTIIHVVRHPIAVIESLLAIKLFSRNHHNFSMNYALKRTPAIHENDSEIIKCCKFYLHWNNKIHNSKIVNYRHRIEDNIASLFDLLGIEFDHTKIFSDTKANTRNQFNRKIISTKDIPNKKLLDQLEILCNLYGYDLYSRQVLPQSSENEQHIRHNNNIKQITNLYPRQETQNDLYQALELLEKYQQQLDKTMTVLEKLSLKSANNQTTNTMKLNITNQIDILDKKQYYRKKIEVLVKSNPNQLSVLEYELIVNTILSKLPCNFLIFGVGKDSSLWLELNSQGKTIFIEDNQEWISKVKQSLPDMQVYHVDYGTKLPEWNNLLQRYKDGEADCLSMSLPDEIYQTHWDIIFVDAPAGYGQKPGRMKSIYLASQLAIQSREIDIFVHDCNRQVEDVYTKHFLGEDNLVTEVSKLRYFHIKNDKLDGLSDRIIEDTIRQEEITSVLSQNSAQHNALIAGVSMVKDEEDIIYYSLEGNYKQGIDKFVILDNLSSDQTVSEIKRFMKDYPDCMVYLIEDQDVQFHKFRKMSALAEFAYRLWNVEWIFPFDADEVIDSESDLLSNILTKIDQKHLSLRLGHKNYILRDFYDYSEPNPLKRMTYRAKKSPPSKADKVMVRWQPGMIILQGHHFIELAGKRLQPTFLGDEVGISLRHYRFRSLQQLKNKIVNGGLAYQLTPDLSEKIGLNWRELYKEYLKKGEIYFDELYQSFFNKPQEGLVFDPAFSEKDNLITTNINEKSFVDS